MACHHRHRHRHRHSFFLSFFLSLSRSLMTYRGFLKNISSCGFHFIFLAKNFETESKERFLSKYVFLFSRQSSIFLIWQQSVDFLLLHYLQYLGTYEACFFGVKSSAVVRSVCVKTGTEKGTRESLKRAEESFTF